MHAAIVKTDVPTLQDEIDRKSFETLEWLTHSVSQGRITADQFSVGVDVLFMTASGLLKKDFIDLITAAQELCPKEPLILKRYFSDGHALVVEWTVGTDRVSMGRVSTGAKAVKGFDTSREAKEWFQAIGGTLESKGYKEI
jgi:hypothetical protein